MDADLLAGLRALADLQRLRIVARLAERPADAQAVAIELGLPLPAVRRQLETLAKPLQKSGYGEYLLRVLSERLFS